MDDKLAQNVLVLSEYFWAGDAITALNLFSRWDKSSLFVASRETDFFYKNFRSGYRIGGDEVYFVFPFKYFNRVPASKIIDCSKENPAKAVHAGKFVSTIYLRYIVPLLKFTGLFAHRVVYKVSDRFLNWIDEERIEYVYTSVGSLSMAQLVYDMMEKRPNLKFIIHCYDDWVEPNYFTLSRSYTKQSSELLKAIISRATYTLTSSEKMAKDYSNRYNRTFAPFPNPVKRISNGESINHDSKTVTFIGKINNHNIKSILLFASALSITGMDLTFDIYSEVRSDVKDAILSNYKNSVFHGWVEYTDIPGIIRNSRILYLPISIDKQTVKFTQYSMSTKMSEYLSSGVPILYHGPDGIAMTELLEKYKCAYVFKSNDTEELARLVKHIIGDEDGNRRFVDAAMQLFQDKFDIETVSTDLQRLLS